MLTRRFRALKMWLVPRCYGTELLRDVMGHHLRMVVLFEEMVRADVRFEVMAPRRFALVCFWLRPPSTPRDKAAVNDLNKKLLEAVNANRRGPYMSSAMVAADYLLRCAVGSATSVDHGAAVLK